MKPTEAQGWRGILSIIRYKLGRGSKEKERNIGIYSDCQIHTGYALLASMGSLLFLKMLTIGLGTWAES